MLKNLMVSSLIFTSLTLGAKDPAILLPKCEKALTACNELVRAQDKQIKDLKDQAKALDSAVEAQKPPILPTWAVITISVATGIILGHTLIK